MTTTPEISLPASSEPDQQSVTRRQKPALLELLSQSFATESGRISLLGALAAAVILGIVFRSNLIHFFISWSSDENYSHGFLVPVIALYFANLAAEKGPVAVRGGGLFGSALLATALLFKLGTEIISVGTLGDLALIVSIAGATAILGGAATLKRYWFAIAFLVFMVPLPVALYALIASPLQLLVSQVASVILNATGVPVLAVGNMMTLPGGVQMFVAEACSGMRQLTGFLALTAAVAYLTRRPSWYRGSVMIAALPIAMTANIARVTLTGYIMYFINPEYASGTFHTVEGLLMLGLGLSLLRAFCWVLDQVLDLTGGDGPRGSEDRPMETPRKTPAALARGSQAVPPITAS